MTTGMGVGAVRVDGKAVLVVDDDSAIRQVVALAIRSELGVRTLFAADGKQALQVLLDQEPTLIITDVRMPNLDGAEMIRKLRECEPTQTVPVLVMSASRSGRDAAMAAGGTEYLDKPFDLDALIDAARRLLEA